MTSYDTYLWPGRHVLGRVTSPHDNLIVTYGLTLQGLTREETTVFQHRRTFYGTIWEAYIIPPQADDLYGYGASASDAISSVEEELRRKIASLTAYTQLALKP